MTTKDKKFEDLWWEMEEIEPLTPPSKKHCNESDEVPTQSTKRV